MLNFFFFEKSLIITTKKNEEIKVKMYDILVKEKIPFYLNKFEQIVCDNGSYFVSGKVCEL